MPIISLIQGLSLHPCNAAFLNSNEFISYFRDRNGPIKITIYLFYHYLDEMTLAKLKIKMQRFRTNVCKVVYLKFI